MCKEMLLSAVTCLLFAGHALACPLNLNRVSAEELSSATGIPITESAKIMRYRYENGEFESLNELYYVPGLSPQTIEQLRSDAGVCVDE